MDARAPRTEPRRRRMQRRERVPTGCGDRMRDVPGRYGNPPCGPRRPFRHTPDSEVGVTVPPKRGQGHFRRCEDASTARRISGVKRRMTAGILRSRPSPSATHACVPLVARAIRRVVVRATARRTLLQ